MIDFQLTLQSDRVLLRPMKAEDLNTFKALTTEQSLWIYFTSDLSVERELEAWVDSALRQMEEKSRLALTIVDKATNRVAGSTSFGNISSRDRRVEIGWTWLGKSFQGQGLASQSKHLMLSYCFETLEFVRVECKTDVLNLAARHALAGIGMIEEGVLRSHTLMTHGRRRDTVFYSILRPEWPAVKAQNRWS
jgi:RimJ/RimL family protein N-acetyltransferase